MYSGSCHCLGVDFRICCCEGASADDGMRTALLITLRGRGEMGVWIG